jgi:hypothetical protein
VGAREASRIVFVSEASTRFQGYHHKANATIIFDLRRNKMKLSPPKQITWFITLALAVLALLGYAKVIAVLTTYDFWLAIAAALLLVATIVKGL